MTQSNIETTSVKSGRAKCGRTGRTSGQLTNYEDVTSALLRMYKNPSPGHSICHLMQEAINRILRASICYEKQHATEYGVDTLMVKSYK